MSKKDLDIEDNEKLVEDLDQWEINRQQMKSVDPIEELKNQYKKKNANRPPSLLNPNNFPQEEPN